jgi:CheY-like chemotaxis protein
MTSRSASRIASISTTKGIASLTARTLAGTRLLILEDEFLIAMDIEQLCRDHGASECFIARSLSELEAVPVFDLGIVDLKLGGDSTLDFARSLRDRRVPFIFATGYSNQEEVKADFPDTPVVTKPYSGADLIEALAEALSGATASTGSG